MDRLLAFFAALVLTTVTVSSACTAAPATPASTLSFILEPGSSRGDIQAHFRKASRGTHSWSSSFAPGELAGLDIARFRAAGTAPLGFAIVRDAGRLDCTGSGGNSLARGSCRFTPNRGFMAILDSHGVARPTEEQAYALMAVNVRRQLLETLAAARYPTPRINDLVGLTAVGVSERYISDLAGAGYRPDSLDTLLQFAALGITADYVRGFVRLGYGDLPASELVQLKALDVTPEFIAGFERLGYGRLPASKLVQLKALGVTPDYVRSVQRAGDSRPSLDKLFKIRALGFAPRTH